MSQNTTVATPPDISFQTFLGFLDWLKEVIIPNRIDHSFFAEKFSAVDVDQFMVTARFLELIDTDSLSMATLEELSKNRRRKSTLRKQLLKCYAGALGNINLERASIGELEERFRTYSIEGETLHKALAFFIDACEYSNIPLSPHNIPTASHSN